MASKYRLEIEVVLNEKNVAKAVEIARAAFNARGGASALLDGGEQPIPAEQFIHSPEQAIMELVEGNPLFEKARIRIEGLSCRCADAPPSPSRKPEISSEDELDVEETGLYVCRWPNGDFSIVVANSKREAIIALDEWDAARPSWLTPMDTCMIDFRLNARGGIEFAQFGHETADFVWKNCYPALDEVLTRNAGDRSPMAIEEIKKAVKNERTRLRRDPPPGPNATTEIGRELQRRLGAAGPVADRVTDALRAGRTLPGSPY